MTKASFDDLKLTFEKILEGRKLRKFDIQKCSPWINPTSGDLTIQWADVPVYHEQMNENFEVIKSMDGDRVVGVFIYAHALKKAMEEK